jgi:hypothetical protein
MPATTGLAADTAATTVVKLMHRKQLMIVERKSFNLVATDA